MGGGPVVVLHIEDDEEFGKSVALLLRTANCVVFTAGDGEAALQCVIGHGVRPDVLIADFMLPGDLDGADVVQAICGHLHYPIPTILLSGQLASAGLPWLPGVPLFCAAKPFDSELLLKVVETFADLGRFLRSHRRPS